MVAGRSAGGAAGVLETAAPGTAPGAGSAGGSTASGTANLSWRGQIFRAARQTGRGAEDDVAAGGRCVVHAAAGRVSNVAAPIFRAGGHCHGNNRGRPDTIRD